MSGPPLAATFIGPPGRRLFVVHYAPHGAARGGVLLIPPFAEEMNKSRRMLTLVAKRLAEQGFRVVLPDLFGTGDSDGEFAEGNWLVWKENLRDAKAFLEAQGNGATAIVALRTGCALVADAAQGYGWQFAQTVFWQPVVDGKRFLTQFLRLRVAASLADSDRRESVGDLLARLRSGETLEIGGYDLSPTLAAELEQVSLVGSLGAHLGAVRWIDVVRDGAEAPSEATQGLVAEARRRQATVEATAVQGVPFWATTEIVELPVLVERTVEFLAAA